jgi:hypothetical protein
MKDFETHDRGTAEELKLSRALAAAINQLMVQYGDGIIPHSIQIPYKELVNHYNKSIEMEKYQNGI